MKLEIRRNLDIKFNIDREKNREAIEKLLQQAPELTPEQKKILDHNERIRDELYEKIWSYLEANPTKDLDGNTITRETHEIGFDTETQERDGCLWEVATQFYVRPKISENEKQG